MLAIEEGERIDLCRACSELHDRFTRRGVVDFDRFAVASGSDAAVIWRNASVRIRRPSVAISCWTFRVADVPNANFAIGPAAAIRSPLARTRLCDIDARAIHFLGACPVDAFTIFHFAAETTTASADCWVHTDGSNRVLQAGSSNSVLLSDVPQADE